MNRSLAIVLSLLVVSCDRKQPEPASAPSSRVLPTIRKIVADQLRRSVDDVQPDTTFGALGADDLDLVEIILTTEKALNITIDDEGLTKAAGVADPNELVSGLTVREFATFVDGAPRRQPRTNNQPNDGGLRLSQVGSYDKLSKLPNPMGLELVFVPSLEELTAVFERNAGRKLTPEERAELKSRSVVIAMSPEDAEQLRRKRFER